MSRLKQHQRHNEILRRLKNGETLSITQLAREMGTTSKTLQRDFVKLQEAFDVMLRGYLMQAMVQKGSCPWKNCNVV